MQTRRHLQAWKTTLTQKHSLLTRALVRAVRVIILTYLLFGAILYVGQRRFIYHPNNQNFLDCPGFENYEKREINGTRFYYLPTASTEVFIYYHGNAGSACDRSVLKDFWEPYGMSMIFVEYAGYSNDTTAPTQEALLRDVENINTFVSQQAYDRITLYGESIGSGPATYHTTLANVDTVLLMAPFPQLADVAANLYPAYPVRRFIRDDWPIESWLRDYQGRLVILHGDQDSVIAPELSERLFASISTNDKHRILIEGANHNDIYGFAQFWSSVDAFLLE